jgi:hypothetical protein
MVFNLQAIEAALQDFQNNFDSINDTLEIRRESFTPVMIGQIVEAYEFLNSLLRQKMDLFTPAGLHSLLELNHTVLCGRKQEDRQHYYQHLVETRKSFQLRIAPIKTWVLANRSGENAWKLATGFYTRMLSRPQLFLEGNHRTGNIILNYLLVSKQAAPFIIQRDTAREYLDLSGNIKFTSKENTLETAFMMPAHAKRFREFLKTNGGEAFICMV